jgi:hypothetical protein
MIGFAAATTGICSLCEAGTYWTGSGLSRFSFYYSIKADSLCNCAGLLGLGVGYSWRLSICDDCNKSKKCRFTVNPSSKQKSRSGRKIFRELQNLRSRRGRACTENKKKIKILKN